MNDSEADFIVSSLPQIPFGSEDFRDTRPPCFVPEGRDFGRVALQICLSSR